MLTVELLVDQQAGINLNLFGAIAGAFSGLETKETDAEGKSTEYREGRGHVQGKRIMGCSSFLICSACSLRPENADRRIIGCADLRWIPRSRCR